MPTLVLYSRCGRVVCGSCSAVKTTYLPSSYVVCPPSQIFLETPHIPHRTCDECVEELEMIRSALRAHIPASRSSRSGGSGSRAAQDGSSSTVTAQSQGATPIVAPLSRRLRRSSSASSIIRAPVTSANNRPATITSQEHHNHHNQNVSLPTSAGPSSSSSSAGPSTSPQQSSSCAHKRIFQVESTAVAVEDEEDDDNDNDNDADSIAGPSSASDQHNMALPPLPATTRSHRDSASSAATLTSASGTPQTSSSLSLRRSSRRHNHESLSTPVAELDEDDRCPVCNRRFDPLLTETDRENHITECLKEAEFSGSLEQTHRANRMIVYKLSAREAKALGECVICFEDFVEGDSVGRLECLCIYHEKCILDWFARKGAGECPVHAVHV